MLRSTQNSNKCTFLDNLKTITQTDDPTNDQLFPPVLFVTFIFVFEKSQNSFYCSPSPFVPFWSALYLNLVQKLPIWIAHHTFLKSRHPEVTKKPYYVFPPREAKKGISSWIISVRVRHSQVGFCTGVWRVYGLPPCGPSCL